MPRPSMNIVRKQQVLTAYVSAVSKQGLSGATLEEIAAEANLSRPLVRHHLGNKDAMFELLVNYVILEFGKQTNQLINALPSFDRVDALIEMLLGAPDETDLELVFVFAELTMKSVSNKALVAKLATCVAEFEAALMREIRAEFPSAADTNLRAVGHGILAIYFNFVLLAPLGFATRDARQAVNTLVRSLK